MLSLAGLWIGALGIFLQAVTGAKGYPKVPPGIPARLAWTAALGLFLVGLIWIGVFTTSGTAYRLQHPQDLGPLIGTPVQMAGMALALLAGIATVVTRFRHLES